MEHKAPKEDFTLLCFVKSTITLASNFPFMSSLILFKISCLLYSGEYSGNLGGLLFISVSSCIYSHCIKLIYINL